MILKERDEKYMYMNYIRATADSTWLFRPVGPHQCSVAIVCVCVYTCVVIKVKSFVIVVTGGP